MHSSIADLSAFLKDNKLFEGMSPHQLEQAASIAQEITFNEGEIIIQEGDFSDNLYLIEKGHVEVRKWDESTQQSYQITTLGVQDVVGELSILDNSPRSASVIALRQVTVIVFSIQKLREVSDKFVIENAIISSKKSNAQQEKPLLYHMIQNLAVSLSKRVRTTTASVVDGLRKELAYTKMQLAIGLMIVIVITNFVIYIIALALLKTQPYEFLSPGIINLSLITVFASMIFGLIWKSGYPLEMYGFTLKNWKVATKEALICSLVLMILAVITKWFLIHFTAHYEYFPLFNMDMVHKSRSLLFALTVLIIYLLFVPLQELIVRGAFQSLLEEFLLGRFREFWAIVLPNLIFAISHFHISIAYGLMVFIPGLVWSYLYARNRSLLGVTLSHQIVGVWGLGVVGF